MLLPGILSHLETPSLHPTDAVQGFGISQQVFCRAKFAFAERSAAMKAPVWLLVVSDMKKIVQKTAALSFPTWALAVWDMDTATLYMVKYDRSH